MGNTVLALKVNKFIHEQCIDGVPHDIGANVMNIIESDPSFSSHQRLTKLEYYSGQAMQGMLSNGDERAVEAVAKDAVACARALLKELESND